MKIFKIKHLCSIFQLAWGRTPLFIIWGQPKDNIDCIRKIVSKEYAAQWRIGKLKILRELMRPIMFLMWPFRAFLISCEETKKYAEEVYKITGKTKLRQLKEQFILLIKYQVSPEVYYFHQCYKDEVFDQAKYYINGCMAVNLQAYLDDYISYEVVNDKLHFENVLRENKIPVVKSIALVKAGEIDYFRSETQENNLPKEDLLIKPLNGVLGKGIECFWFQEHNFVDIDGKKYDSDQLKIYLQEMSKNGGFLIQPLLNNHSLILDLGNGALSTVRILTAINIHGEIEVVIAAFKMACGQSVVDNYSAKGIACPIDLYSGCIGSAVGKKPLSPILDSHPDSGATITGRKLPFWDEIIETVINGHLLFQQYIFLGWDVAITQEGPKVIEANGKLGIDLLQVPQHFPLGQHRFADISVEWIKQKNSCV